MNMIATHMSSTSKLVAIAVAAMALSICTIGKARADAGASPAGRIDDRQVVQKILDVQRSEEQTSEAVKPRLSSPEAWILAERIGVDHAVIDRDFRSLLEVPTESTGDGAADAGGDLAELLKLSGDALDKAYVDREVKSHQAMLRAIDNQFLPAATSDELRRSLVELRADATAHLAQARSAQHAEQLRQTEAEERAMISREIENSGP